MASHRRDESVRQPESGVVEGELKLCAITRVGRVPELIMAGRVSLFMTWHCDSGYRPLNTTNTKEVPLCPPAKH
jgi:hypothetical protein